jgi:hypothetical protein
VKGKDMKDIDFDIEVMREQLKDFFPHLSDESKLLIIGVWQSIDYAAKTKDFAVLKRFFNDLWFDSLTCTDTEELVIKGKYNARQ